ncbi:MAG: glycosyltransferase family 2 protein [Candidatus Sericytochromatia bacterium]|nr:glycosyltransferase family 2 protein [Candidatus Sericytochromatia bacterium]
MSDSNIYTTPSWEQKTAPPDFTVVIPCYNHAVALPEAVRSVVAQRDAHWELVIVNDGSTDQSESVARSLLETHSDLPLTLISQSPSGHPAHARNTGIAQARAEWILCLDADDQINDLFLASTQALIQAKPWIGLAYPLVSSLNDPLFEPVQHSFELQKILEWVLIPTATVFRKAAWEKTGGYYPTGYEDWDFWLSCIELGYFPQPVSEAIFYYRSSLTGVYGSHLNQDGLYKARIIERHPALFSTLQRYWAQKVLANPSELALQKAFRAGTMPQFTGDQLSPCTELLAEFLKRWDQAKHWQITAKERFELFLTHLPFSEKALEFHSQSGFWGGDRHSKETHRLKWVPASPPFPTEARVEVNGHPHSLKLPLPGPFQADLAPEIANCLWEHPQRLLLLGNPQDPRWENSLEFCLRSPQSELLFALWLPEKEPEEWLLDWLDSKGLDPENMPEMVLLPDIPPEHCPVTFAFFEQIYLAPGSAKGLALQVLLSGKILWTAEAETEWLDVGIQTVVPATPWFERLQSCEPKLKAIKAPVDFRQRWNQHCLQSAREWYDTVLAPSLKFSEPGLPNGPTQYLG